MVGPPRISIRRLAISLRRLEYRYGVLSLDPTARRKPIQIAVPLTGLPYPYSGLTQRYPERRRPIQDVLPIRRFEHGYDGPSDRSSAHRTGLQLDVSTSRASSRHPDRLGDAAVWISLRRTAVSMVGASCRSPARPIDTVSRRIATQDDGSGFRAADPAAKPPRRAEALSSACGLIISVRRIYCLTVLSTRGRVT